jgi:CRP-like cAMP-binding protein
MDPSTTQSLLERAADLDAREALGHAAEALRLAPADHRARAAVARLLADRGHTADAAQALVLAGEQVLARGYPLLALAYAKASTALQASSAARTLLSTVHARIAGRSVAKRLPVPAPAVPQPLDPTSPEALTRLTDEAALVTRARALATTAAPSPPADVALSGVPLFSELSAAAFIPLVEALVHREVAPDEAVVRQGEAGSSLFLVVSGEVEVSREVDDTRHVLARLGPGALVGEMALITEQPRSASVVARTAVEVFVIERAHVEQAAAAHPGVTQELVDFGRRRLLRNLMDTSPLFRPLTSAERLEVLRAFSARVVPAGTALITRGEEASGLFLIATGEVRVSTVDGEGASVALASLRDGEVLGEIGLLEGGVTTATAVATRKTVVLHLPRAHFAATLAAHPEIRAYLAAVSEARKQASAEAVASSAEVLDADDLVVI